MPSPNTGGRVPAIPSTANITDPHIRAAIDALRSGWNVRNGTTGRGDYAFITKAEVEALISGTTTKTASVAATTGGASTVTPVTPQTTFLQLVDVLPNQVTRESMGWAVDMVQKTGAQGNQNIAVGIHSRIISDGAHRGGVYGISTESWNAPTKTGGFDTALVGGVFSVINAITNSTAAQHSGVVVAFKNRLDSQSAPVNGPGIYNRNTRGVYIDSQARSAGTNCGWETGIYFSPGSLDQSTVTPNAVGIDMSPLDQPAPQGGRYYQRLAAAIALPPNTPVTWDGAQKTVKTLFNAQTGNFEFRVGSVLGGAINFSNGILFQSNPAAPPLQYYLDMADGFKSNALMSIRSAGRTIGPASPVIASWVGIYLDNQRYVFPIYK